MWNTTLWYLSAMVIVLAIYYNWSRRRMLALVANMNAPPALPLIGHSYLLLKFTSTEAIAREMRNLVQKYPSPLCIHLGPLPHIVLYEPEHMQVFLNSPHCLNKSLQYKFFLVDRGLFSAPASLWKGQRKILNFSFGPAIMNSHVSTLNQKSAMLAELMEKYVGQKERDFFHSIALCTLDTIYCTAFGCDFDLQRQPVGDLYLKLQAEYIDIVTRRVFNALFYPDFIYRLTNAYKKQLEIMDEGRLFISNIMSARNVDKVLSSPKTQPSKTENDDRKPQNFLDKLLELAQENTQLAKEDIPDHLYTMIFAGTDTTATTVSNVLLMLAVHQEIQERVYQEIMAVCPAKDQQVSVEDVAKLLYTEMVCKETLRLFPVAPVVARITTSDIQLDAKTTIPNNTTVVGAIYPMHRDPRHWGPDAEIFNPDNFLPELVAQRHPYAFIPFSGGPRNCIGVRYAWLSMKVMIAHILRKYRLKTSHTMDTIGIEYSIILKITGGCRISLEKRDHPTATQ
ncbi:probable cytochrome P450 313a4 isoform X2 [Wyeomyia smithii]|uniref:probable cytochrome P450 313a4 isoform X2 n=1 Tax=Wyeomyia smithii TaxID=174621 RepID=UPI002467F2D7|nr:probable cytochrome P450 313a4 isoform X2 [Wyeomyia smithii]